jgi:hypothetical protein
MVATFAFKSGTNFLSYFVRNLSTTVRDFSAARQSVIVIGSKLKPQVGATIGGATTRSSNQASSDEFQSNMEYAAFPGKRQATRPARSRPGELVDKETLTGAGEPYNSWLCIFQDRGFF